MTRSSKNHNAGITRGRPFAPGNPGKPMGARRKATLAIEALLDGEAEALTRKAIDKALEGDTTALRLCLERIAPPRRDRPITFDAPELGGATDIPAALAMVVAAAARGDLTLSKATELAALLDRYGAAFEREDLERRIRALEEKKP